jgi:hypothetical protein
MDAQVLANALSSSFIGFRGSDTELLSELFAKSRSLDVPSNVRAFRFALKALAPELLVLGVHVEVFDSGVIHILTATAAQKEASEEARARMSFNLPENASVRAEFGTFERFYSYKRGLDAGRIHPPRRGRNSIDDEDKGTPAQVDPRLSLEAQCRARWDLEPETRSQFSSVDAFIAFERANSSGQVRRFAPSA